MGGKGEGDGVVVCGRRSGEGSKLNLLANSHGLLLLSLQPPVPPPAPRIYWGSLRFSRPASPNSCKSNPLGFSLSLANVEGFLSLSFFRAHARHIHLPCSVLVFVFRKLLLPALRPRLFARFARSQHGGRSALPKVSLTFLPFHPPPSPSQNLLLIHFPTSFAVK